MLLTTYPVTGRFGNVFADLFWERPRGPILGARDEEAPTSPPTALRWLHQRSVLNSFALSSD